MMERKAPKELRNCPRCKSRPNVVLVKRIKEIPNMIMFDENNLFYRVECMACKDKGVVSKTGEYKDKKDAYKEWNNAQSAPNAS